MAATVPVSKQEGLNRGGERVHASCVAHERCALRVCWEERGRDIFYGNLGTDGNGYPLPTYPADFYPVG